MMGTQLKVEQIHFIVKKPIGPIIGFLCQFGLMPLVRDFWISLQMGPFTTSFYVNDQLCRSALSLPTSVFRHLTVLSNSLFSLLPPVPVVARAPSGPSSSVETWTCPSRWPSFKHSQLCVRNWIHKALVVVMMPLWLKTLGTHFMDDSRITIPFGRIVQSLFAIAIPTTIGILFTYFRPQYVDFIQKWITVSAYWMLSILLRESPGPRW